MAPLDNRDPEAELRRQRARERLAQRQARAGRQDTQGAGGSSRRQAPSPASRTRGAARTSPARSAGQGPVAGVLRGIGEVVGSLLAALFRMDRATLVRIGLAIAGLVVIVFLVTSVVSCVRGPAEQNAPVEEPSSAEEETPPPTIDPDAILASLGDYPDAELAKLLKLADNDPLAYDYVADFPNHYPSDEELQLPGVEGVQQEIEPGTVPLLLQWDKRWGYASYCTSAFGMTGCGPTCMAMVYQGLTGKTDLTPFDMGMIAKNEGYMYEFEGTDINFFFNVPSRWGIDSWTIDTDEAALREALGSGALVICNVGAGDFTTDGHFIVLTGLDENGDLIVNDPYSSVRSEMRWPVSTVIGQTKLLMAFS